MTSLRLLAWRRIAVQRQRSALILVTLFLTAALLTVLGVLVQSVREAEIRLVEQVNGAEHGQFRNLTAQQWDRVRAQAEVAAAGYTVTHRNLRLPDGSTSLWFAEVSPGARQMLHVRVDDGRLPDRPGEVAVERWALKHLPGSPSLNGSAYLDGETWTIVGILADRLQSRFLGTALSVVAPGAAQAGSYTAYVQFRRVSETEEVGRAIARRSALGSEQFQPNRALIAAMTQVADRQLPYLLLYLLTVAAGLTAVNNLFHLSVLERIKQFGLLRCAGATPGQVRRLVALEALWFGLLAVLPGAAVGLGLAHLAVPLIISGGSPQAAPLPPYWHWGALSGGLTLLTLMLAAWRPAARAGRISPLEAVRNQARGLADGRLRPPGRRMSALMGALGRSPAWQLASRNLSRNHSRYLVTALTLALGVTLLVGLVYFSGAFDTARVAREAVPLDYSIYIRGLMPGVGFTAEQASAVEGLPGVAEVARIQYGLAYTDTDRPYQTQMLPRAGQVEIPAGRHFTGVQLYGYSEKSFERVRPFLVAGEVNPAALAAGLEVLLVTDSGDGSTLGFRLGDRLRLGPARIVPGGFPIGVEYGRDIAEVRIGGILRDVPLKTSTAIGPYPLRVVADERFVSALTGVRLYNRLDVGAAPGAERTVLERSLKEVAGNYAQGAYLSFTEERGRLQQELFRISMMVWAVLAVILLVGLFSLFTTIHGQLLLRTHEFGLLRAVGMTVPQVRRMVLAEGALYGITGTLWGAAGGAALSWFLFDRFIRPDLADAVWTVPYQGIIASGAVSLLLCAAATFPSLRRLQALTVIEGIRAAEEG